MRLLRGDVMFMKGCYMDYGAHLCSVAPEVEPEVTDLKQKGDFV